MTQGISLRKAWVIRVSWPVSATVLLRLQAAPADWASANAEELMMLAAIAGDDRQVDAIFNDAVRDLDESEAGATWALLLVAARRAAGAELSRDRTGPQSP